MHIFFFLSLTTLFIFSHHLHSTAASNSTLGGPILWDGFYATHHQEENRWMVKIEEAVSNGDAKKLEEAVAEIEAAASATADVDVDAQSVMGWVYGQGIMRGSNEVKAFLFHYFAAKGGNNMSKMVLAYTYNRLHMHEEAVKLYAELAEIAASGIFVSNISPPEVVRIHYEGEESKETLKRYLGEASEDFWILEDEVRKGKAVAMYKIGLLYYCGLRGVNRDYKKAFLFLSEAANKGDPRSMELLGDMYVKGIGVERNYTKAFGFLMRASEQQLSSAYNYLGYLYIEGYGVEKNLAKAKECFEKSAENKIAGGQYNLGIMYLHGIGVERDIKLAVRHFLVAANAGLTKAYYQLAKMFQTGSGLRENLQMAISLYKLVADRELCASLSERALQSYVKGEVGKALLLYSRLAEMGNEVAQSNAAWILDKYGEQSRCIGETGFCTDEERHRQVLSLWWQASDQGDPYASMMVGNSFYYGRGVETNYELAAEAYMIAGSANYAEALLKLGYMHEHGQGLPLDSHLAKRYYEKATEIGKVNQTAEDPYQLSSCNCSDPATRGYAWPA